MVETMRKEIDNYLKFKYNIPALDDNEKIAIEKSEKELLSLYKDKLEKTKSNLFYTLNGIIETLNKFNAQLTLSHFYLGSIYRDLYFALANIGISTTPFIQTDKESKITINKLKEIVGIVKTDVINSSSIIELIEILEEMKTKVTVANNVYKT